MEQSQAFDSWAVVELFGHQKIAGRVSEVPMAGTTFLKVEVPETNRSAEYTRYFGAGAIYGITPCTEDQAKAILDHRWSSIVHPEFAAKMLPAPIRAGGVDDGLEDEDEDEERPF